MTTSPPTTPKPRRRLQFSLRALLMLMLVLSVGFGWWHQRQRIAEQSIEIHELRREVARLRVKLILSAGVSDETKIRALAPYVKTGDAWGDVCSRLGPGDSAAAEGPGFGEHEYQGLGLFVTTYPDGE